MSRRGANIYRRKDGRWEGRIVKEGTEEGCPKYSSVYGKNYNEVKLKLDLMKNTRKPEGEPVKGSMADIMETWLKEKGPSWKKTTHATYRQITYKYIIPKLGDLRADKVDGKVLEAFAESIRLEAGDEPVSDRHVRNICGIALRALRYMKKKYNYAIIIPDNVIMPVRRAPVMLPGKRELGELERYLTEHVGDDSYGTCLGILTVFYTGIRIGEACALTWGNVNPEEEIIYIRKNLQRVKAQRSKKEGESTTEILLQTPKTGTSFRMIPIPPVLSPLLKKYQGQETEYMIKGRKKAWVEPRTLQYRFAKILEACGIKSFNFHMLRHAFATRCIDTGFDVKSLSEILGHSSVQVTLNLYVHSSMQHKKELMGRFEGGFYRDYGETKAREDAAFSENIGGFPDTGTGMHEDGFVRLVEQE